MRRAYEKLQKEKITLSPSKNPSHSLVYRLRKIPRMKCFFDIDKRLIQKHAVISIIQNLKEQIKKRVDLPVQTLFFFCRVAHVQMRFFCPTSYISVS
jgi:hypothetical protein